MKSCKKIVSCFLCIAILTSFLCVPAFANEGIAGAAQDFFEWSVNWSQGVQNSFWKAIYGDSWMEGENGGWIGADRDELTARYNEYVSSLQTDLGTSAIASNGLYLPVNIDYLTNGMKEVAWENKQWSGSISGNAFTARGLLGGYYNNVRAYRQTALYAPVSGFYTFELVFAPSDGLVKMNSNTFPALSRTYFQAGDEIIAEAAFSSGILYGKYVNFAGVSDSVTGSLSGSLWYFIEPDSYEYQELIPVSSRPTSIVGDYGIIGDDGTIIKVDGNMIVDESTSTVFNPVTNVTNNYTDYVFDYSDRSYNLTLEDGSTLKVVYGNENITIQEGDIVYNVYYLLSDSSEDPGGSGGSGDTPGTDDGSGWAWLQGAWTQMMDKLSQIREAIVGLELSPEINVEVEGEGDEQVTQESWFTDVLSKFSFLSSIHDIYSQLIADVTSDAATAAAVADGEIMLADVTIGHAATDGRASYTAPELAISFGSSDKYGVDWAGIRPLDLSWYAPYKETVDGILSGILWLSYLFLLIKRAPGIIRGSEMITEDRIKIDAWTSHPSWIRRHGR